MATSTGKTVALIVLVLLIIFLGFQLTPLIIAPFGVFTGVAHTLRDGVSSIHIGPMGLRLSSFSFFSFLLMALWIAVIVWVYRDAERRGMNGILWALLVFIGNLIGLLIYLIVRNGPVTSPASPGTSQPCPQCQKPVSPNFEFCPHCGARMEASCPQCKKPVEKTWAACPYCGNKLKD